MLNKVQQKSELSIIEIDAGLCYIADQLEVLPIFHMFLCDVRDFKFP